ncbi:heterokaryon incompatibility protein-domain-containing protein, partial [Phaeosphaeriaceae sp. PMI808]
MKIRLLKIKPSNEGERLQGELSCVALGKKCHFIALSYFWGKSNKTKPILVNGYEIPIMKNLYQAFMQLRKQQESVFVWVDAICINQGSVEEKNYQVGQMTKIYSAAEEVIAWLGESNESSDRALDLLVLPEKALWKQERTGMQKDLDDLFAREYWSRVWVIQEIASALR